MAGDIATIAAETAAALAPAMPALVTVGAGAAGEIGKRTVGAVSSTAMAVWRLLKPRADASPPLSDAISEVAKNPSDQDAVAALRLQIRRLLESDPDLLAQMRPLLEDSSTSVTQIQTGEGSVAIGRDMKGGRINTGDRHRR